MMLFCHFLFSLIPEKSAASAKYFYNDHIILDKKKKNTFVMFNKNSES